jgi:hypothetical protein
LDIRIIEDTIEKSGTIPKKIANAHFSRQDLHNARLSHFSTEPADFLLTRLNLRGEMCGGAFSQISLTETAYFAIMDATYQHPCETSRFRPFPHWYFNLPLILLISGFGVEKRKEKADAHSRVVALHSRIVYGKKRELCGAYVGNAYTRRQSHTKSSPRVGIFLVSSW